MLQYTMENQLNGSRTIFNTPTPEFIEYALGLPEKIIQISNKQPEYEYIGTQLIDTEKERDSFLQRYLCKRYKFVLFI